MNRPARGASHLLAAALLLWLATSLPSHAATLYYSASDTPQRPLVIYGVMDIPQARPLLEDFHRRNPDVAIEYHNLESMMLHARVLRERDAPQADVLISPAMPWQYQLANEGISTSVDSPAAEAWPDWASWRQELFGFTFEPIVMVYRRDLAEDLPAPRSHAALLELLNRHPDRLRGRVVTYDPSRSGAGYSYAIEDARISARYWDLVAALGRSDAALETTTAAMLRGLEAGRYWIGYNLTGSYVQDYVAHHPTLAMVVPDDYALVQQRLAMLSQGAPHPDTGARFIDYLLSREAQTLLARETPLGAVHPDIDGAGTAAAWRERLGDAIRPVEIGPALLATLDTLKRQTLLEQWRQAFANRTTASDGPIADPTPFPASPKTSVLGLPTGFAPSGYPTSSQERPPAALPDLESNAP